MGGKLVLITNRKSHMAFRLVLKSVTLNDLERRNGRVVCVISPNSVDFGAYYVKVVEDTRKHSASEMLPKESSVSGISLMAIFNHIIKREISSLEKMAIEASCQRAK